MNITIYTNSTDKRYLNKNLKQIGSYSGLVAKDNLNILTPEIILTNVNNGIVPEIMGFANYCYIPNLLRYYYIVDKKLLTGQRISFSCMVDPIYTYKDAIKNCTGTAVRNENIPFSYIVDDQVPVESYLTVKFIAKEPLFDNTKSDGVNFILNIAGGGS